VSVPTALVAAAAAGRVEAGKAASDMVYHSSESIYSDDGCVSTHSG